MQIGNRALFRIVRAVLAAAFLTVIASNNIAVAADVYIAEAAAGSNDGSNCSNAHAYGFFNDSTNWGGSTNQIGPGTTIHLCGVFNAPAGANRYLEFQGSGINSQPIILKFESG